MPADPVQRRLAAILAADVAGYSRLMGEDETGTPRVFELVRLSVMGATQKKGPNFSGP